MSSFHVLTVQKVYLSALDEIDSWSHSCTMVGRSEIIADCFYGTVSAFGSWGCWWNWRWICQSLLFVSLHLRLWRSYDTFVGIDILSIIRLSNLYFNLFKILLIHFNPDSDKLSKKQNARSAWDALTCIIFPSQTEPNWDRAWDVYSSRLCLMVPAQAFQTRIRSCRVDMDVRCSVLAATV